MRYIFWGTIVFSLILSIANLSLVILKLDPNANLGWTLLLCAAGTSVGLIALLVESLRQKTPSKELEPQSPSPAPTPEPLKPPISEPPPIEDQRWLGLVKECVELFNEIERNMPHFDGERFELAEHITYQIREILERNGVETITDEIHFDGKRHQVEGTPTNRVANDAMIEKTLTPGFAVGRRILKRAKVSLITQ